MLVDDEWRGGAITYWIELYDADYRAAYVGTDTVDGRETHVVEIEPAANESPDAVTVLVGDTEYAIAAGDAADERNATSTTTWWIDAERRFPIKERIEIEHENPEDHVLRRERSVWTVTYEDVRFDEEIPDDRFAFEPPAGTETYEPPEPYGVETVAEADEEAPFSVREPAVPDRFDLVSVDGSEFRGTASVELLYRAGEVGEGSALRVRIAEDPFDNQEVVERDVGAHDGARVSTGFGPGYAWECGDAHYQITRNEDSEDAAALTVELADSIECSDGSE